MGGLKTLLSALVLTTALSPGPARAIGSAEEQLRLFATCAGRLSALMEHQWMFDGEASEQTMQERNRVVSILEAVLPEGRGREVLSWRIDAKMAYASLLTRATFNDERRDRVWAMRAAEHMTAECRSILLG